MTKIGTSSLDVYPLCLGGNTFGWTADTSQSFAILDEYADSGGNFVDTADVYSAWADGNAGGESEVIIGQWLQERGKRDELVIATKVGKLAPNDNLSAPAIRAAAEASLRRLGTEHIDLYYAHAEDPHTPLEETVQAFADLTAQGKIRYVGLSNFSPGQIRRWMGVADQLGAPRPVALQPHYNLLYRKTFETTERPVAEEYDLSVMPYFSLASGLLTGKYRGQNIIGQQIAGPRSEMIRAYLTTKADEEAAEATVEALCQIAEEHNVEPSAIAIAWLLEQPAVCAPIASASKVGQVPPLLEGATLGLDLEEISRLDHLSARLSN